jgi:hypothetical protein
VRSGAIGAAVSICFRGSHFLLCGGSEHSDSLRDALRTPDDIDPLLAREGTSNEKDGVVAALRDWTSNRLVTILLIAVILSHLASAAMLPRVGEIISAHHSASLHRDFTTHHVTDRNCRGTSGGCLGPQIYSIGFRVRPIRESVQAAGD